jgi:fructose-1,6-bisphosphatase/inositol monophosphatase family enzyme
MSRVDGEGLQRYDVAMDEHAAACFGIAPRALGVIRETRDNTTRWKGRGDPLSAADEASEEFIVAQIRSRFPDDEIICEDAPKYPGRSGYWWLCDPLDGTLNFIRGGSPWGVSVAVMKDDDIIAAASSRVSQVMYTPQLRTVVLGEMVRPLTFRVPRCSIGRLSGLVVHTT